MKAIVLKTNLKNALLVLEKIATDNGNLAILKNILIKAENDALLVSATNLEVAVKYNIPAKVITQGEITVNAGVMSQLIQAIPSERINIETVQGNLEVQSETVKSKILTTPTEDFPIIPKVVGEKGILNIAAADLKEYISSVAVATQQSDLHPELASILLDFTIDSIVLAATDSFRLCEKTMSRDGFDTYSQDPFKILIPIKTAQEISRIFSDDKDVIEIRCDQNQVAFTTPAKECVSRLNQGNFPEYQSIIPKTFKAEIIVNRDEMIAAIKTASIVSGKSNEVIIDPSINEKNVKIKAADEVRGAAEVTVSAKITGMSDGIRFNAKYLMDGLRIMEGSEVFIGLSEENKPAAIRDIKEHSMIYIVMPVIH
ncbi:MAG: hypothetical protein RIQ54_532 [Candidatus Parcubacteria bacterium]|jgi:DNA polymerase-3 subunit beta